MENWGKLIWITKHEVEVLWLKVISFIKCIEVRGDFIEKNWCRYISFFISLKYLFYLSGGKTYQPALVHVGVYKITMWGLFDRASFSWNKVKYQLDATRLFYWYILSSTCIGYIRPPSGALDVELQHMVFCTEFLDGWWSCEPLCMSCVRCGWCFRTAPSAV